MAFFLFKPADRALYVFRSPAWEPTLKPNGDNTQGFDETEADGVGQRPPSQPATNVPPALLLISLACIVVHLVRMHGLSADTDRAVIVNFAFIPLRYAEPYFVIDLPTIISPLTYSFIHGDWAHLLINIVWLVAFGSPVAWRLGWWRICLFWLFTAVCAAALHAALYWNDPVPLIGASGAVSGFMGAAARFGFRTDRRNPRSGFGGRRLGVVETLSKPPIVFFLLIWMVANYLAGAGLFGGDAGSIAWEAHVGGLVAGFFGIDLVDRQKPMHR